MSRSLIAALLAILGLTVFGLYERRVGANINPGTMLSSTSHPLGKLVDEANATGVEGSEPDGLFQLVLRVRWLYPVLPRWRFRAPQSASLKLAGLSKTVATSTPDPHSPPTFSASDKYLLIKETDDRCYWCSREIGSQLPVRGLLTTLRLEWDHVVPEHLGGPTDSSNMVPACHLCNRWKAGNAFATEADIRAFLEARWVKETAAPSVELPFPPAPIVEGARGDIAPVTVLPPRGKPPTARDTKPEVVAETSGLQLTRQWKFGDEVVVVSGSAHGRSGTVQGRSHTREGWIRVLLSPQLIPWRFLPEQLSQA